MEKYLKLSFSFAALSLLSACTVSFNNDLVSSHSDEIEAYTAEILEDFYARRTDDLLKEAVKGGGFSSDAIESIYEFISETSKPELAVAADRNFRSENSTKIYETIFHIPRSKGREVVKINVIPRGDSCCQLYGLHLNQQIGEQYVMETAETTAAEETESASEKPKD